MDWNGKPYHSLDYEMKRRFGTKVYKIALEGGMTWSQSGRHHRNWRLYLLQRRRFRRFRRTSAGRSWYDGRVRPQTN